MSNFGQRTLASDFNFGGNWPILDFGRSWPILDFGH